MYLLHGQICWTCQEENVQLSNQKKKRNYATVTERYAETVMVAMCNLLNRNVQHLYMGRCAQFILSGGKCTTVSREANLQIMSTITALSLSYQMFAKSHSGTWWPSRLAVSCEPDQKQTLISPLILLSMPPRYTCHHLDIGWNTTDTSELPKQVTVTYTYRRVIRHVSKRVTDCSYNHGMLTNGVCHLPDAKRKQGSSSRYQFSVNHHFI